jgi:hypothetical protein
MEFDLQSLLGLLCTAVLSGWDPATLPLAPHLGSYTRALFVSQDRRHLFVTPWLVSNESDYCAKSEAVAFCHTSLRKNSDKVSFGKQWFCPNNLHLQKLFILWSRMWGNYLEKELECGGVQLPGGHAVGPTHLLHHGQQAAQVRAGDDGRRRPDTSQQPALISYSGY